MKTKVDEQAVRDLLSVVKNTPQRACEILMILRQITPLLEMGHEERAIKIALHLERKQYPESKTDLEYFRLNIYYCIRELDHYANKRRVVEAALAEINDIAGKAERLKAMQQQIIDIFHKLDERTKAILEIKSTLESAGGEINVDFCNLLDDIDIDPTSVETLRNESESSCLVDAYKLAREIIGMS